MNYCKYCSSSKPCVNAENSIQLKIHTSANNIVNALVCTARCNTDEICVVPYNYQECEYFDDTVGDTDYSSAGLPNDFDW